jgi:Ca2+/Na+ antiporter
LHRSTLSDGKITVWEAWLYPALYVIYIILCTYWKQIEAKIHGGNPLHGINKMPRIIKSVVPKRPRHESVAVYAAAHKIHLADFQNVATGADMHASI